MRRDDDERDILDRDGEEGDGYGGATAMLRDGTPVEIRTLDEADVGRLVNFFRHVPVEDRLFLREDVVVSDVVYNWVRNYGPQRSLVLLAEADGEIIGNVTIERQTAPWSRHVGEMWVLVARDARGQGVGRQLVEEGFRAALGMGLEKIVVPITANQVAAVEIFRSLGFTPEALLTGYVKDPRGQERHDLVIMAHDVAEMLPRLALVGAEEEEELADA